jgi:hypothetical protein
MVMMMKVRALLRALLRQPGHDGCRQAVPLIVRRYDAGKYRMCLRMLCDEPRLLRDDANVDAVAFVVRRFVRAGADATIGLRIICNHQLYRVTSETHVAARRYILSSLHAHNSDA